MKKLALATLAALSPLVLSQQAVAQENWPS